MTEPLCQSLKPSYFAANAGLPVMKVASNATTNRDGVATCCARFRAIWMAEWDGCCRLMVFHVGNVILAIVGMIAFAMFVLASVVQAPVWFLFSVLFLIVCAFVPVERVNQLAEDLTDVHLSLAFTAFILLVPVVLLPFALISFRFWVHLVCFAILVPTTPLGLGFGYYTF